jgi:hypothetical protein
MLLFDERGSQRSIAKFAREEFAWLDQLAIFARIVLFIFVRPELAEQADEGSPVIAVEGSDTVANPSLEVARAFGIGPNELPGVVFFTDLDLRSGPNTGVFWPVPSDLFLDDRRAAENAFSTLFTLIQEVAADADSPEQILQALDAQFRLERIRGPILAALRAGLVRVVKFPGALIEAVGQAWGAELARRMSPP